MKKTGVKMIFGKKLNRFTSHEKHQFENDVKYQVCYNVGLMFDRKHLPTLDILKEKKRKLGDIGQNERKKNRNKINSIHGIKKLTIRLSGGDEIDSGSMVIKKL